MANIYQVHTNHGRAIDVTTDDHHDDHHEHHFKEMLMRIVEQGIGRAAGEVIVRVIFKGRR
jgi:hypothetical protein